MDKVCPNCGERYKWYEAECPNCHVALVDAPDAQEHLRDLELTVVFRTMEAGLLPLIESALEDQNIEFMRRVSGSDALTAGGPAYRGTAVGGTPFELLVRSEDESAARELLRGFEEQAKAGAPAPAPPAPPAVPTTISASTGNVELVDLSSKSVVGRITEDELTWLNTQLEKESEDDRDYYFDRPTLDMLDGQGASPQLMAVLRGALGSRDDMDLQWSRR